MTRIRKIGGALAPRRSNPKSRSRRMPRGTDGRPVRARRIADPVGWRIRLLRLGALLLAFAFFAVLWTRPIRDVEVRGMWMASGERVTSILSGEIGRRWISTPVRDFERALAEDPWIAGVKVSRSPGGRILVEIDEAQPVFCAGPEGGQRIVDRRGLILPVPEGLRFDGLPRLDGVSFESGQLETEHRRRFLRLIDALDDSGWLWSEGLARVDLADPSEILLQSSDAVEVVIALPHAHDQLAAASAVWQRLDPKGPARVDLRFKNQVVLSD